MLPKGCKMSQRPNANAFLDGVLRELRRDLQPAPVSLANATSLAPLIRKARKRMGMNQQAFADYAGVGRRFLSELENGKASLEFDKVLACARTAGIDIFAKPRQPL
jgi:y4mF family transcriptional regulator